MASPESLEQDVEVKGDNQSTGTSTSIVAQTQHLYLDDFRSVAADASPDFPDRIYDDLREYELDDQEYTIEEGSGLSSDTSGSSDLSEEANEEDLEEFPVCHALPLPEIRVTTEFGVESPFIHQHPLQRPLPPLPTFPLPLTTKMPNPNVPKPGPAKLPPKAGLEEWLAEAKQCHYLPETVMKQLCEMVKECLMEGGYHVVELVSDLLLTPLYRIQYPTCLHTSHDLR
jgi:hypothetical protein